MRAFQRFVRLFKCNELSGLDIGGCDPFNIGQNVCEVRDGASFRSVECRAHLARNKALFGDFTFETQLHAH